MMPRVTQCPYLTIEKMGQLCWSPSFWLQESKGLGTTELQHPGVEKLQQMQTDHDQLFLWVALLIVFKVK